MKMPVERNRGKSVTEGTQQTGGDTTAIREVHLNIPESEITELRRRINATRWPEGETVMNFSRGFRPLRDGLQTA
jgi:hypothetical protein